MRAVAAARGTIAFPKRARSTSSSAWRAPGREIDYFKAPNPANGDAFGLDLALDARTLVVGAVYADTTAGNTTVVDSGAVYVFR